MILVYSHFLALSTSITLLITQYAFLTQQHLSAGIFGFAFGVTDPSVDTFNNYGSFRNLQQMWCYNAMGLSRELNSHHSGTYIIPQ
jgi:hypothetical protein